MEKIVLADDLTLFWSKTYCVLQRFESQSKSFAQYRLRMAGFQPGDYGSDEIFHYFYMHTQVFVKKVPAAFSVSKIGK